MTSSPFFKPTCPRGGSWYACGNYGKFTGCCAENPCTSTGCSQGNLYAASFDAAQYGKFPDQQCSGGQFYTCVVGSATFMGCCTINPCSSTGCPRENLASAFLSNDAFSANQYDPEPPLSSSQATAATTSATRTADTLTSSSSRTSSSGPPSSTLGISTTTSSFSMVSSGTAVPGINNAMPTPAPSIQKGPIIGGAVGGGIILVILLLALWYRRHVVRSRHESRTTSPSYNQQRPPPEKGGMDMGQTPYSKTMLMSEKPVAMYEAPDTRIKPPHVAYSPVPLYTSSGPYYHEVEANEGYNENILTLHTPTSQWSPATPPGSPEQALNQNASSSQHQRSESGYSGHTPISRMTVTGGHSREPSSSSSPLEYNHDRGAWTATTIGLGMTDSFGASHNHRINNDSYSYSYNHTNNTSPVRSAHLDHTHDYNHHHNNDNYTTTNPNGKQTQYLHR